MKLYFLFSNLYSPSSWPLRILILTALGVIPSKLAYSVRFRSNGFNFLLVIFKLTKLPFSCSGWSAFLHGVIILSDKIQSLLPRAIELAEKENRELLEKKTTSLNNYNSRGLKVRAQSSLNIDYNPRPTVHKPFRGYDSIGTDYDDGSVEVDVSRYSGGSVISEPRFKSKVAESIWRLKNKK